MMLNALKKVALGFGATIAVLLVLAGVAYFFGGPSSPSNKVRAAYEQLVDEGAVEPVDSRFVLPIPGCVCHSSDPVVIMEHSERRIRDCGGCH